MLVDIGDEIGLVPHPSQHNKLGIMTKEWSEWLDPSHRLVVESFSCAGRDAINNELLIADEPSKLKSLKNPVVLYHKVNGFLEFPTPSYIVPRCLLESIV